MIFLKDEKRFLYLDIARAFAIIFMVAGHCDPIGKVNHFVNLFHMALFVFISGYLFKRDFNNFKIMLEYLKRKLKKIYLFYLKYEVLFFCLTNFFFLIGFYSSKVLYGGKIIHPISSFWEFLLGLLEIIFLMGREPFCGAFWFLISLMFIYLLYSGISFISNIQTKWDSNKFLNLGIFAIFLFGCFLNFININIPRFGPSFTLLLFFYFGILAKKYSNYLSFSRLDCFFISLFSLFVLNLHGTVAMNINRFSNPIYLVITGISGIYAILYLSRKIEDYFPKFANYFQYIGVNTLPIMAFHFISFKVIMFIQILFKLVPATDISRLIGRGVKYDIWYIFYILCGIFVPILINRFFLFLKVKLYKWYLDKKFSYDVKKMIIFTLRDDQVQL